MAPAEVLGAIEQFRCCKNYDIEHFLRHNALEFERRGLCTTYLYADTDSYEISGYFSLTHKALSIGSLSKERRKDITGNKTASIAPFILLGQLGKRMEHAEDGTVIAAPIAGDEMLRDAFFNYRACERVHHKSQGACRVRRRRTPAGILFPQWFSPA